MFTLLMLFDLAKIDPVVSVVLALLEVEFVLAFAFQYMIAKLLNRLHYVRFIERADLLHYIFLYRKQNNIIKSRTILIIMY